MKNRSKRRFSDDDIADIRRRRAAGQTLQTIADWYWVNVSTIARILDGTAYRDA